MREPCAWETRPQGRLPLRDHCCLPLTVWLGPLVPAHRTDHRPWVVFGSGKVPPGQTCGVRTSSSCPHPKIWGSVTFPPSLSKLGYSDNFVFHSYRLEKQRIGKWQQEHRQFNMSSLTFANPSPQAQAHPVSGAPGGRPSVLGICANHPPQTPLYSQDLPLAWRLLPMCPLCSPGLAWCYGHILWCSSSIVPPPQVVLCVPSHVAVLPALAGQVCLSLCSMLLCSVLAQPFPCHRGILGVPSFYVICSPV